MLFLTIEEHTKMIPVTSIAPVNAAKRMATKPLTVKALVITLPPSSNMTSATPSPAPLLMPKMLGPASGLRKAVCSIKPLTASDAPDSMAVRA